jgi:hypothetical protein
MAGCCILLTLAEGSVSVQGLSFFSGNFVDTNVQISNQLRSFITRHKAV